MTTMAANHLLSEVSHLSETEFPPLNPNVSNLNTKFPVAVSYISTIANEAKNSETIQRKQKKHPDRECKTEPERPWVHLFRKGKARILSSGRVVGNLGSWHFVKDNRFTALIEENLADKETFNNTTSSETNGPNLCIKNNIQQRGHQGSQEGQLEASTKEWVRQSVGTSPNNQEQNMVERVTIDTSAKQNIGDQLQ
ncbi:hypothetical protein R3W88_022501 [Solanum pinnatisectum]|uniref:Uncharacterized protein n=1 Tax=Solanum pinnatisectum TaxID=50273 RepID=A0AAV9LVK9_9SOLN|nr:hypothetical protein R3W88_022501 [Solanum pinnatisectum]